MLPDQSVQFMVCAQWQSANMLHFSSDSFSRTVTTDVSYTEDSACPASKDNLGKGLSVERDFFADDRRRGVRLGGVCFHGRSRHGSEGMRMERESGREV